MPALTSPSNNRKKADSASSARGTADGQASENQRWCAADGGIAGNGQYHPAECAEREKDPDEPDRRSESLEQPTAIQYSGMASTISSETTWCTWL
jgi:hypothetical protein